MKHILILFVMILSLTASCRGSKDATADTTTYATAGHRMSNAYEKCFSMEQFDSICLADTIPHDLSKWNVNNYKDYETKQGVAMYLYIKRLGDNQLIYRAEKVSDDTLKISKRITVSIQ